jgi:hypothetical protein
MVYVPSAFDSVLLRFDHLVIDIRETRKKLERITELRLSGSNKVKNKDREDDNYE